MQRDRDARPQRLSNASLMPKASRAAPAARVAMLVYGYLRGGEKGFALASAAVLVLLAVSALL